MTRAEVIAYFGTQEKTAEALNIKQPSVAGWPKEGHLPDAIWDKVVGRMHRKGIPIPEEWLKAS